MRREAEVVRLAHELLRDADAEGKLPTPGDRLLVLAELTLDEEITLDEVHDEYFTENYGLLKAALAKTQGLIDFEQNRVYLDSSYNLGKQRFVLFHEIGHKCLPWHHDRAVYVDDDDTLDLDTKMEHEAEANLFASEVMFQGARFERDAQLEPLGLPAVMRLSARFGASVHATLRRYVERHALPMALFAYAAQPVLLPRGPHLELVREHRSAAFERRVGTWAPPALLSIEHELARAVLHTAVALEDVRADVVLPMPDGFATFLTHVFRNGHHVFVLLLPRDGVRGTRVRRVRQVRRL